MDDYIISELPKRSTWSMHIGDITWTPLENKEPNWFHRLMQRLILGFHWKKNTKSE